MLSRTLLAQGFDFQETRIPLLGPQGIFKPAMLELPLSITPSPEVEGKDRPYEDEIGQDGPLSYRYRGTDPSHRDNRGLRALMARRIPLIYFIGIVPGEYLATWPVFVVGDSPAQLAFSVQVDARELAVSVEAEYVDDGSDLRRRYVTQQVSRRLHQEGFKVRVLRAYRDRCAVCQLGHLLDAAHILADHHPKGEPVVRNGLALCKLHHAAFDQNILGIRPDLVIEIRKDVLKELDGPMLRHGLQGFQGEKIIIPPEKKLKPNPDFLEERYELFKKAS